MSSPIIFMVGLMHMNDIDTQSHWVYKLAIITLLTYSISSNQQINKGIS